MRDAVSRIRLIDDDQHEDAEGADDRDLDRVHQAVADLAVDARGRRWPARTTPTPSTRAATRPTPSRPMTNSTGEATRPMAATTAHEGAEHRPVADVRRARRPAAAPRGGRRRPGPRGRRRAGSTTPCRAPSSTVPTPTEDRVAGDLADRALEAEGERRRCSSPSVPSPYAHGGDEGDEGAGEEELRCGGDHRCAHFVTRTAYQIDGVHERRWRTRTRRRRRRPRGPWRSTGRRGCGRP